MVSVRDAIREGRERLARSSASAGLDAELLLAHVLGLTRGTLLARDSGPLAPADLERFRRLLDRRARGEPVAYLTGHRGFRDLELEVTPDVLVPRPETELLVELALRLLDGRAAPAVLDLGTGSGAIALAIARELPQARVVAVDSSLAALAVARRNALAAGIGNVAFVAGHWLAPFTGSFDAIVGNPPYVAAGDPHLPALASEPQAALVAGPGGLEAIEEILRSAPPRLAPGGWLVIEHGATQGPAVRGLFGRAGLADVATHRDLAGLERATTGRASTARAAA